jgi:hypothetical protein
MTNIVPIYYYGTWFIPSIYNTHDWMGSLFIEDGHWVFEHRVRLYADSKAFGSEDEKTWYKMKAKDDSIEVRDRLLENMNKNILPKLEKEFGCKHDFVLFECKNDDPKFLFELGSRPWAHIKTLSPEEAKAQGLIE